MKEIIEEYLSNKFGIIEFGWHQFLRTSIDIKTRKAIYQDIIPIKSLYDNSQFMDAKDRMICYSELFREIKEGEKYPTYDITIQRFEDGSTKVIKVEERQYL